MNEPVTGSKPVTFLQWSNGRPRPWGDPAAPAAERRHRKARHGSAGKTDV